MTTQIDSEQHSSVDRPTRDELGIRLAIVYSTRGTCLRAQVGAVIVRGGRAISAGYVGSPSGQPHCTDAGCLLAEDGGCIRTVHAEANAISFAARAGASTEGSTLYTTHSPCLGCAKLIINAGIRRVVYDEEYRITDGVELLLDAHVEVEQI